MGFFVSIAILTATALLLSSSSVPDAAEESPAAAITEPAAVNEVPTPASVVPLANCGVTSDELAGLSGSTPTIVLQSKGIEIGESVQMPLVLNQAPNGMAGYLMEVSLDNPDVATIIDVDYPAFGLTRKLSNNGSDIRFAVVDLMKLIESGDSNSTLAILSVEGLSEGNSGFHINVVQMDDDSGDLIVPETVAGTLTIC